MDSCGGTFRLCLSYLPPLCRRLLRSDPSAPASGRRESAHAVSSQRARAVRRARGVYQVGTARMAMTSFRRVTSARPTPVFLPPLRGFGSRTTGLGRAFRGTRPHGKACRLDRRGHCAPLEMTFVGRSPCQLAGIRIGAMLAANLCDATISLAPFSASQWRHWTAAASRHPSRGGGGSNRVGGNHENQESALAGHRRGFGRNFRGSGTDPCSVGEAEWTIHGSGVLPLRGPSGTLCCGNVRSGGHNAFRR